MKLSFSLTIACITLAGVASCASPGRELNERALSNGLTVKYGVEGAFPALIYMKPASANDARPLLVFLEGDGVPWRGGMEPNDDPTTKHPLALDMLIRSPGPAAYITRPCYNDLRSKQCTPEQWTSARYSDAIVESMASNVRETQRLMGSSEVTLVGYSGGGVLAVLIAERLDHVRAVVTFAANLNTDAWTQQHGFLPLSQSLNPSRSERLHPWTEFHFQGADDINVPPATTDAYFERYPQAGRKIVAGYDHACCWLQNWDELVKEAFGPF